MNDIERAIAILKYYRPVAAFNAGFKGPQSEDVKAFNLAIEALEEKLNGGWTNAIEKPSKSDDYLVYYHKKYDSCNFETNLHGICSFIDIYGGWQTEEGETILAWQSLPEPYKEA